MAQETLKRHTKAHWRDELDVWASPILANMLWLMLFLPVVTIPLAFAGLYGVMFRWMRDDNTQVFTNFFGTIRRTWHKVYALAALDLVVMALLYFNLMMFQVMDMGDIFAFLSRSATLLVGVIFLVFNVIAWVVVSVWDAPLKQALTFSLQLVFAQPIWALLLAVAFVFPFVLAPTMPAAAFIVGLGALAAYISSRGTQFLVSKYRTSAQFKLIDLS